jgi:hypothetical protein
MKKIGLIACSCYKLGKSEPEKKFKAEDIYIGNTFRISKRIGLNKFNCDDWHILSAKFNLLEKDDEISYYDVYLARQSAAYKKSWAQSVISKLKKKYDLEHDVFYIFGGKDYYKDLLPYLHCFVFGYKNSNTIDLDNMTEFLFGNKVQGGK